MGLSFFYSITQLDRLFSHYMFVTQAMYVVSWEKWTVMSDSL